jgi:hypothetical protein
MYDLPEFFLVANPIDRYSIGDRTPGLRYGEDGSLTITIQHDQPQGPTQRANWLPAPQGDFRPALRIYNPARKSSTAATNHPPSSAPNPGETKDRPNRQIRSGCRVPGP